MKAWRATGFGSSSVDPSFGSLFRRNRCDVISSPGSAPIRLDSIGDAVETLRGGGAIVAVDDEGRENEGDMIFAASTATAEQTAFMIRHTSGFICVGMQGEDLDRLNLPPMTVVNEDRRGTAYAVTVDSRDVESTGISADDRARTMRTLADPSSTPHSLTRPGHVMPLRAVPGGVLRRPGHTEAAVDLVKMAGLPAAGALCEMVNDDGSMMDAGDCRVFCDEHGIPLISIADLIRHRLATEKLVVREAGTRIPTIHGVFDVHGYRNVVDGSEHFAMSMGDVGDGADVLVRVHAECVYGDVFWSKDCACRERLDRSLELIAAEGRGVLVYVRPQSGQVSVGDANAQSDEPHADVDQLDYGTGSQILTDLGVTSMLLLTAHPERSYRLDPFGLSIAGVRTFERD